MIFSMTIALNHTWVKAFMGTVACLAVGMVCAASNPANDLSALSAKDWNADKARHLLERAGFGATPQEVAQFARMTPSQAVQTLVRYQRVPDQFVPFDDSGSHDDGLEPFASSRPAAASAAVRCGRKIGIRVPMRRNSTCGIARSRLSR